MRKTTTTTMALVATLALIGIGSMPTATANQQCDKDFDILAIEPPLPRELAESASEIGSIEVSPGNAVNVSIRLESDESKLVYPIWFQDTGGCEEATSMEANCDDDVLETNIGSKATKCTLQPHSSIVRTFFFDFENVGSGTLEYKPWED